MAGSRACLADLHKWTLQGEEQQQGTTAEQLPATQAILMQLPWEQVSQLGNDEVTDICSHLFHYLGQLAQQDATDGAQAVHMAQAVMQV